MEDLSTWMNKPTKRVVKKKRPEKSIIYNAIAVCSDINELTDGDPFWTKILNDFSRGKPPAKGFTYDNDSVKYKRKSIQLSSIDDDMERTLALIHFIRENGKLFSDIDREQSTLRMDAWSEASSHDVTWKIYSRNKKMRDQLLSYYISSLKTEYKLDKLQTFKVRALILEGVKDGRINETNIIINENAIVGINGLIANRGTKEFSLDPALRAKLKKTALGKVKERDEYREDMVFSASTSITHFTTLMFK